MAILKYIWNRILIGLGIWALGALISWVFHDWKISNTYFTLAGTIMIVLAAFPYAIGSKRAERKVRLVLNRKIDMGVTQATKEESAAWSITLGIIGAVNVIFPVLLYYLLIHLHVPLS